MKLLFVIPAFALSLLTACQNDDDLPEVTEPVVINDFLMTLNGEVWKPDNLDESPCHAAYECVYHRVEPGAPVDNLYTIAAFRTGLNNETYGPHKITLMLLIAGIDSTGLYYMDGSQEEVLVSKAFYTIYRPDNRKIKEYVNDFSKNPFYVTIDSLYPQDHFDDDDIHDMYDKGGVGIGGTFGGTLYDKENPADYVEIENGTFTFKKINGYTHCDN